MRKLIIWGAGGHAREIVWLCEELNIQIVGLLDERPHMKGLTVEGLPILGTLANIEPLRNEVEIVCAGVGDPALKRRFSLATASSGFRIASPLIHPNVRWSRRNVIGAGSMIFDGAVISDQIRIGQHVIVNRSVSISHDSVIGDYATLGPGVCLAGNVVIEAGAYIGMGASIREKTNIGSWSVVGGGAFVKDDIPEYCMAAGVPAVVKKKLRS